MPIYIVKNEDLPNKKKEEQKKPEIEKNASDSLLDFIEEMVPRPVEQALKKYPQCPICYSTFYKGEQIRVMPKCQHPFHARCIDKWLLDHKAICPIDKQKIDPYCKKL